MNAGKYLILSSLLLAGCAVLPGMQNPDTAGMHRMEIPDRQPVRPVLKPITTALLRTQRHIHHEYRVAPADVLSISVWQHPELSPPDPHAADNTGTPSKQGAAGRDGYLINASGNIHFPLAGKIHVAGKTVEQIRLMLSRKLEHYLQQPEINVRVADFRSRKIYVLGEIKNPGFIPFSDQPLSITDAIVMSGGIDTNTADPAHIYIIRGKSDRPDVYWLNARTPDAMLLAEGFDLKPGDVLFVSSAPAARWNRIINELLPTIQTIWYTKAIVDNGS